MESGTAARLRGRVLVVDDESSIASMLAMTLRFLGYEVALEGTGRAAISTAATFGPDVVLLDVMLPDLDGFEVCARLRDAGVRAPVLFLTARGASEDKVKGLGIGDDYVTKPFDLNELVARIGALQRRGPLSGGPAEDRTLRAGWVELDQDAHEVRAHGEVVALSVTEFELLRYLLANAGRAVTKAQILDRVWSYDFNGESGVVETYVYYLRRKLGDARQTLIRTVRGVGYLMSATADARP